MDLRMKTIDYDHVLEGCNQLLRYGAADEPRTARD
jgi:hypothetical protein